MKPRVNLYTLWVGPLPTWLPQFEERVGALGLIDWKLLRYDDPRQCCANMGLHVNLGRDYIYKDTPYSCGDLRPLLASVMIPTWEWWGWCDLDVVFGDLDRLLPPLLTTFDVVSAEPHGAAGCLTLFRNTPQTRDLWRQAPGWEGVLLDPKYRNFDEVGFALTGGNPSVTRTLRRSNLRCHFDWRSWHEEQEPTCSGPLRWFRTDGKRVIETPTGRELLLYHFRGKNGWPDPKRYSPPEADGRAPRVLSPDFWAERLRRAKEGGEVHRAVADVSFADWKEYQARTAGILRSCLKAGDRVLDCGCGPGLMRDVMPAGVDHVGVDFCEDMIEECGARTVDGHNYFVQDLRTLGRDLRPDSFDWCVCRNLEASAEAECSDDWAKMRAEMLRVAPRLLLIDFKAGSRVIERGT